jgi:ribonuclease R
MINTMMEADYDEKILPLYGKRRDSDNDKKLLESNTFPHAFSVEDGDREDFTSIPCYTIDPDGCLDADDGFSIYEKDGELFLAIHIADPTYYINMESELWTDIQERMTTHYPSNRTPIHMMPTEIMEQTSLMTLTDTPKIKRAISIVAKIDRETYFPSDMVNIVYSNVRVTKETAFSYTSASEILESTPNLQIALMISKSLEKQRKTIGKNINQKPVTTFVYSPTVSLRKDTDSVYEFKKMISEFAIFANSFVGRYLRYHLDGRGIFRTCDTMGWLDEIDSSISGSELMSSIIDNGISANYLSTILGHDLVGKDEYCHFTSPIRRLVDCVCHYLLKYIHLLHKAKPEITCPFTSPELELIAYKCYITTKKERKIAYNDYKFRYVQVLHSLVKNKDIQNPKITFRCTGYTGLFLNFIITKINEHSVSISYVLRRADFPTEQLDYLYANPHGIEIQINKIYPFGKFDEDKIPEISKLLSSLDY